MKAKNLVFLIMCAFAISACSSGSNVKQTAASDMQPSYTHLADLNSIGKTTVVLQEPSAPAKPKAKKLSAEEYPSVHNYSGMDLSGLNLSSQKISYAGLRFDTITVWPKALPAGFTPSKMLETGKNPGLKIKALHKDGITGAGVNIAFIGQPLSAYHEEFKDRFMVYEYLNSHTTVRNPETPFMASLITGKTTGVAPEANIYYIETSLFDYMLNGVQVPNTDYIVQAIERVIKINGKLPKYGKIKILVIDHKFIQYYQLSAKVLDAIKKAEKNSITVFYEGMNTEEKFGGVILGLDRPVYGNPDQIASYLPEEAIAERFYQRSLRLNLKKGLFVPSDSRTGASQATDNAYLFRKQGNERTSYLWFAGLYALALQVNPNITPSEVFLLAHETGDIVNISYQSRGYNLAPVVNPVKVMDALKKALETPKK